ncbi:carboxymuconolactone decarboxylase family protein [Mycobacterium hubeiense]|uniref:carboxymuconolactone decarboxylase family protein n=1 Tax=Mycobacterium hubeiense TaxID=1867256 RepID=UPI000C7F6E17|nr:carboxymuconolactone decarboxylase family protein [Mycobacterium sp. QGD 101]
MALTPLPDDQWDDDVRDALASMVAEGRRNREGAGNALATLVRHPKLTAAYLPFSAYLLQESTLPPRLREFAILRVAHRISSAYEWGHHVELGEQAGLTSADIAAARNGDPADDFDRTVLTAVDELLEVNRITADTWAALGKQLDDRARMDLIFTVGGYVMLGMALNTFGVELEPDPMVENL